MYGKELILDIHECNAAAFTREAIENYFVFLCDNVIFMERAKLVWWDYEEDDQEDYDSAPAHLKGTSGVQFISTSTIVIHTLDDLRKVFINIFSCKDFDPERAAEYTAAFFGGCIVNQTVVERE